MHIRTVKLGSAGQGKVYVVKGGGRGEEGRARKEKVGGRRKKGRGRREEGRGSREEGGWKRWLEEEKGKR